MRATNPREVAAIFIEFAQRIHSKVKTTDPSFIRLSVACGQIEQWREHNYPTFIQIGEAGGKHTMSYNGLDPRTKIFNAGKLADQKMATRKQLEKIREATAGGKEYKPPADATTDTEMMMYVGAAMVTVMLFCIGIVLVVLYFTGDLEQLIPASWSGAQEEGHIEL